jgi:alanine-synthesizing transaminase
MPAEIAPTRRSSRDLREDLMNDDFHRIRRLPPYVFAHIDPIKAKLRASGVDIIDLGMGNPDMPTPAHIVEKLQETVKDPRTHRYSSSRGIAGLRKAQASYYGRRFGVKLNPDTQVVATLGSKEGFANMASAITAPGDVVLVPNPTYPIHSFGFVMSGGVVRSMPADPNEDFMRALDRGVRHSIPKPIALVLNYPSNPTAYTATLDFYKEVVAYCKTNNIFILSDLAYSEIYFDGEVPPSVLEVPGAMDITVEFTSMSKTYSMPGWRVGFAVGNERLISALARVKSYLDYGAFTPIQVAAAAALNGDDSVISEVRGIYQNRRDVMVESFARAGWRLPSPKATMFVWSPIPDQYAHLGSLEFAKLLIQETGVAVAPGVGFGEYGDQYVRLALVENEQRIRQAARNIKKFLGRDLGEGSNVVPLSVVTK